VSDSVAAEEPPQRQSSGYREAVLEADGRGQYAAGVLVDGMPVRMLIDTGATEVCISASTARRLGLSPSGGRKRLIQTANGQSTAYPTILRSVSLDGLYMNDVEALILAPEAGEVNLLGMSFLKRLVSVEQRNGTLILKQ
jgi:aspartyl protease family protein